MLWFVYNRPNNKYIYYSTYCLSFNKKGENSSRKMLRTCITQIKEVNNINICASRRENLSSGVC